MKRTLILSVLLAGGLGAHAQTVVFDSFPGLSGALAGSSVPVNESDIWADRANLAGTERTVTQIDINIGSQGSPSQFATADVTAYLYDSTPSGPGALLWSDTVTGFNFIDFDNVVSLPVPSVVVPDSIFWGVALSNITKPTVDWILGPSIVESADIQPLGASTDPNSIYLNAGGISGFTSFDTSLFVGTDATFAATIQASTVVIPEPGTFGILVFGGSLLMIRRRMRG